LNIEEVRNQIPLLAKGVYLDSAGAGPPPMSVHESMRLFLDEWRDYGEKWEAWLLEIVKAREMFAKLIGAETSEVACVPNVTSGLAAIASALPQKPRQNVVVSELNFPTNVYLWHAMTQKGAISETRVLKAENGEIPISEFENAIDDNTAAVSIDYVSWINGCREDVRSISKIAHKHGAVMIVDAFHAIGALPVDIKELGADVLTCGTYKWLLGPHGAAFLCVRQAMLEQLKPTFVGWHGISDSVIAQVRGGQEIFGRPFDLSRTDPARDATRFEWGTWSVVSVEGARAALEFTLKYPPEERWPLIEQLNEHLVEGLRKRRRRVMSPLDKNRRSGIVNFELEGAGSVAKKLLKEHVIVAPRVNTLRVSPHFYNLEEEIDVLLGKV
jgi:selenocysteine lyase/cysteine desulfurase